MRRTCSGEHSAFCLNANNMSPRERYFPISCTHGLAAILPSAPPLSLHCLLPLQHVQSVFRWFRKAGVLQVEKHTARVSELTHQNSLLKKAVAIQHQRGLKAAAERDAEMQEVRLIFFALSAIRAGCPSNACASHHWQSAWISTTASTGTVFSSCGSRYHQQGMTCIVSVQAKRLLDEAQSRNSALEAANYALNVHLRQAMAQSHANGGPPDIC